MSKNWLTTGMGKGLILPDKKMQLTVRQDDFARKVQAMRTATGKAEIHRMRFVCACNSGQFTVQFERTNPNEKFRITRIDKDQAQARGASRAAASSEKVFDGDAFDTTGWHCAYCDSADSYVHCCWCGANVCKGRTRRLPNGQQDYRCRDGCAATGTLTPYNKVHAEQDAQGLSAARRWGASPAPALPARSGTTALPPAGGIPRLSGPRR